MDHKTKRQIIDFEIERGEKKEKELLPYLEEYFKTKLFPTNDCETDRNYPFDFYSKTRYIEIKNRYNNKTKFQTTIIGKNKYELGLKYRDLKYKVYFIFNFFDELTFYRLKETDNIETFKERWIYRKDIQQNKLHTEIPVKLLKTIKTN
tara:strand:- start:1647 stop:2093 length:447 start_codon:yes stop_codon:yes gene_type:complete